MESIATGVITTIVLSSKTASIFNTVGTNFVIGTITSTISSIGGMIKYFATSQNSVIEELMNTLNNIDLVFTVNVIDEVVKEQRDQEINSSTRLALIGICDILELIHNELNSINEALFVHNTKYLNNWRSFGWGGNINTIVKHNLILRNRCNMLFELLKISNKKN